MLRGKPKSLQSSYDESVCFDVISLPGRTPGYPEETWSLCASLHDISYKCRLVWNETISQVLAEAIPTSWFPQVSYDPAWTWSFGEKQAALIIVISNTCVYIYKLYFVMIPLT